MTYVTKADGSRPDNYLTQSPRTPFQVGKIHTIGNKFYGFSGGVDQDITLAATYPMIDFVLDRSGIARMTFSANWGLAGNGSVGFRVSMEGIMVFEYDFEGGNANGYSIPAYDILIPQERNVNIVMLNQDADSNLVKANVTIVGEYL